jgi:hypothetical protein
MTELKENVVKEILHYKPVKYLVTVILFFIVAAFIYSFCNHAYRCHKGLNSSLLWGMDNCEECKTTVAAVATDSSNTMIKDNHIGIGTVQGDVLADSSVKNVH